MATIDLTGSSSPPRAPAQQQLRLNNSGPARGAAPAQSSKAKLLDRIDQADTEELRRILATCVQRSSTAEKLASAMLKPQQGGRAGGQARQARRARAESWDICMHCDQPSDEDENDEDSCAQHPGELKWDNLNDQWADWDEDCHGIMDSEEQRQQFPENFAYSCCDEDGTAEPCEECPHDARPVKKARR